MTNLGIYQDVASRNMSFLLFSFSWQPQDDYSVSFEDTSYADGFAPPLNVPQRYVVASKETKKR